MLMSSSTVNLNLKIGLYIFESII